MGLYTVSNGNTIYSQDVDQLVNVLSQPSGGQEKGHYRIAGSSYVSGATLSTWMNTLSRNGAPVSIGIDTADQSPVNLNSPLAPLANSNYGGFLVYATSTAISGNCYCAGNYTATF